MNNINVALVGQPNCGKSSIFNMLTNIKQHIANYPGVTIDKKSGVYSHKNLDINIIDLPGTYSFSSFLLCLAEQAHPAKRYDRIYQKQTLLF